MVINLLLETFVSQTVMCPLTDDWRTQRIFIDGDADLLCSKLPAYDCRVSWTDPELREVCYP